MKLKVCSPEESEVRSFLQRLPYISQLSVDHSSWTLDEDDIKMFVNLISAAAEKEQQAGEKILELFSSVCRHETFPVNNIDWHEEYFSWKYQSDFLLDLYSHVKDCETKTGLGLLPSLQSVFQSAPSVWSIDLREGKTSILLEILKVHPEKKHVKMMNYSGEDSEVMSLLQCLPYISQLSSSLEFETLEKSSFKLFGSLFCAAAEREQQTGEKILELLSSMCSYETFPFTEEDMNAFEEETDIMRSDFLLDLYSYVKDCEAKTGLSLLPSFQSVLQSAPSFWSIHLRERKSSFLLEVLKLQPEKKPVKLQGCSPEESEVRSFLQCLPYISQLRLGAENCQRLRVFLEEIQDEALMSSFLSKIPQQGGGQIGRGGAWAGGDVVMGEEKISAH
ncbi:uncharacterized protein KZ484_019476 isoform 2-T3 [Pholidichthys leucotaenia]